MHIWWQVAVPHKDIREGRLDEAVFAADLGDVVQGRGPLDYRDARLFFEKTYLTKGLENLLGSVASRLSGQGRGEGMIQLQTPFGGGKTHSLLALYHFIKHREAIAHLDVAQSVLEKNGLPAIPEAKVAVFVGTQADPLRGKTPWGEIATQLGRYKIVEEHDKKRVSPGKERLQEVFSECGPILILIDEILQYVVKASRVERTEQITKGQTLAFLQEITETVAALRDCVLVLALPASILEQYDEQAERTLTQLQKISGRVETIYTPVQGMEIYEVIRKRLFEDLGDSSIRKKVAEEFFSSYQQMGNDAPPETKEVHYREKIERAYPFHPEFIDVLYERWGSIPTFQRTRGVLRLLGEVVADLYQQRVPSSLIQSSLVNMEDLAIRREFVKHIGNEYDSIIAADIAGEDAKAVQIDRRMGSEYEKYRIGAGLATSIFLYSFSGGERRGISLPRLRTALFREGIPSTIVGDATKRLEEELWYLHSEGTLYYFKNQSNLNRVIVDKEEAVKDEDIEGEIKERLQKIAGSDFDVFLWPKVTSDIPDKKSVKLAVLAPEHLYPALSTNRFLEEILSKAGVGFRVYKNTLFVLMLDGDEYQTLSTSVKRYLALQAIQGSRDLMESLSPEAKKDLAQNIKGGEGSIPFRILSAYRHLSYATSEGSGYSDLGIPTIGSKQTLTSRVKEFLKDQEKLLSQVSPKYLMEKTLGEDEQEKSVRAMYEIFLKTPGLPLLENENVLKAAIQRGVETGTFGIRADSRIYLNERILYVDDDALILRAERAKELKKSEVEEHPTSSEEKATRVQDGAKTIEILPKTEKGIPSMKDVRNIKIKVKLPWDKLSEFVSGVIHPLCDRDAEPQIVIELEANSLRGIDRHTLDNKIRETLNQVGAEIEDWKEE